MNLLLDPWLPVRRQNGAFDWIAPHQIAETDNPPVALDAARPDFNGALIQFLIGLLQTACPPDGDDDWEGWRDAPPTSTQLQAAFKPCEAAFVLDGDGPRFMQDLTLTGADGEAKGIAALLIESPGAQSLEHNADHFIKRHSVNALCPRCAAAGLYTLQTNAPSGGAGHRTGLRGGGPLTTLMVDAKSSTLWRAVWLNVLPVSTVLELHPGKERSASHAVFPWCADQASTQAPGEKSETQPGQVHPLQVYWAMPRRLRLDLSKLTAGSCDVCGEHSNALIEHYVTKNYGLNYKGAWRHPLSPYTKQKKPEDPALPVHPQPGGIGYRYWLGWVLGNSSGVSPAAVVQKRGCNSQYRLWAFGYDMDNMKARGWQEALIPLYPLDERNIEDAQVQVGQRLSAADIAASSLRYALKMAFNAQPKEAKGDYSYASDALWQQTETTFYRQQLEPLMRLLRPETEPDIEMIQALRLSWQKVLSSTALGIFHEHASGDALDGSPVLRRNAFHYLKNVFHSEAFCKALGLPYEKPSKGGKAKGAARKSSAKAAMSMPNKPAQGALT